MEGWKSDFSAFSAISSELVIDQLSKVFPSSEQQLYAWRSSIPDMQNEVSLVVLTKSNARSYFSILEYELPYESRRPDAIFLTDKAVIVTEVKAKRDYSIADIDQIDAYARDLSTYHIGCHEKPVIATLLITGKKNYYEEKNNVLIISPNQLREIIKSNSNSHFTDSSYLDTFLDPSAYCPLPTLVKAARELFFNKGKLRRIHKAAASTEPAIDAVKEITISAAKNKRRRLILVTGVPGAGKTLVGLRLVHSHFLDELKVNNDNRPPAVFLSGNGPLVQVLQYELSDAGGGGKTFVRDVKNYVRQYSRNASTTPPEHVLVYDEAQRAWDKNKVALNHRIPPNQARSEPELFIEFAERIPEWSIVVGLIGSGQEIHLGEEAGIKQWADAIVKSPNKDSWDIIGPEDLSRFFEETALNYKSDNRLSLDEEIRFHNSKLLHKYVDLILTHQPSSITKAIADRLQKSHYHLRITRDIDTAKDYLRERYNENTDARFGIVASSKDKLLVNYGIKNDFQSTKLVKFGPWYGDDEDKPNSRSCRLLNDCVTEFGAQGLELDSALIAWGSDYIVKDSEWDNSRARGYRDIHLVKDPFQLRLNSYRVLLTRARDACVVYIPQEPILDETYHYLLDSGFINL